MKKIKKYFLNNGIDWDYVMIYVSMIMFAVIWLISMIVI